MVVNITGIVCERKHATIRLKIARKAQLLTNPALRIKESVSAAIRRHLHNNHSSKNGETFVKYLDYTIYGLIQYVESKFEPWMTWQNYGIYTPGTWNDNDPTTWTWQLDHIIPHSDFSYSSMTDESFKECWSLENLRPYSAKQNILDGVNKVRHKTT